MARSSSSLLALSPRLFVPARSPIRALPSAVASSSLSSLPLSCACIPLFLRVLPQSSLLLNAPARISLCRPAWLYISHGCLL
ncbi:hypothetical protein Zm00014a_007305 [Zea mays]|uniref:Uncharacterized protein n=1 Tax=Zea mays TaxID=4577 RepID=A0A3L6EP67_MAIZE|nr:hypothetical protein Zm00014a_007305 [Zea mays]